jgi:hypothetical protein
MLAVPGGIEMTNPPEKKKIRLHLAACCPEAQADGVPCTELGRDCEQCERAIATLSVDPLEGDHSDHTDPWAV